VRFVWSASSAVTSRVATIGAGIQSSHRAVRDLAHSSTKSPPQTKMEGFMRQIIACLGLGLVLALAPVTNTIAQDAKSAPKWMQQTFPEKAVKAAKAAMTELEAVEGPGALDVKTKALIGLGVAAQILCEYCVYYHTKVAKAHGATDAQIKEAIAEAALTRKWSIVLNGSSYDMQSFRKQVNAMLAATH
jgi:AhpD family alkylhydroperoxidase